MYSTDRFRPSDHRHHVVTSFRLGAFREAVASVGLMASLDPRRHLSAAIGWSMLSVVALTS